jgi:hypothetical protein
LQFNIKKELMVPFHKQDTISMIGILEFTNFCFFYDYAEVPPNMLMVGKSGALAVPGRLYTTSGGKASIRKKIQQLLRNRV